MRTRWRAAALCTVVGSRFRCSRQVVGCWSGCTVVGYGAAGRALARVQSLCRGLAGHVCSAGLVTGPSGGTMQHGDVLGQGTNGVRDQSGAFSTRCHKSTGGHVLGGFYGARGMWSRTWPALHCHVVGHACRHLRGHECNVCIVACTCLGTLCSHGPRHAFDVMHATWHSWLRVHGYDLVARF